MSEPRDESVSLLWLVAVLLRERRLLAAFTAAGAVVGVALALMRPTTYTTNFSFVPQTGGSSRAGLSSLAGQFGISLGALDGETQPPQFYADLVSTRGVLGPIARDSVPAGPDGAGQVPLATFLRVRGADSALVVERTIRKLSAQVITTVVAAKTGVIAVRVTTAAPQVSLAIAQRLLEALNHFNTVTRQSQARAEAQFTAGRLADARRALGAAEDALARFTAANRDISSSPTAQVQQQRLQREVNLQQQVATGLAQQYEENEIRAVRDTPVLTLIEAPALAAHRDARHGVLIVFLALVGAFAIGVMLALGRDVLARARGRDPGLALLSAEWERMRGAREAAAS